MSYFRAIASRATGGLATGLAPSQMSRSPIAEHDQRLYHGTPALAPADAPAFSEAAPELTGVPASSVSATSFTTTADAPLESATPTVTTLNRVTAPPSFPQAAPLALTPAFAESAESTATPALPFVPSRSYDAPTPNLEARAEAPAPTAIQSSSSRTVLAQALSAVQSWMSAPEAPAVREITRTFEPLPERANATFLPAPHLSSAPVSTAIGTRSAAPAMLPIEGRPAMALPLLESAPRLSIGRVEIEIVRPQITAPAPRPVSTTRAPGRAAAPIAPAAPRSSALDAKRNFGMRQR